ncbi:Gfo/Idh/MocA family oxidoreductase [candidate division KSB1 bacterium]|nr:Gfo/Idh/MocA family oxidoreductase [candidate division KSB1 bacterium]
MNRRKFLGATAATFAATIVPRHVLGGPGYIAPSDKINIGYIGCGTQGIREMTRLITNPEIQITSVCDPNQNSTDYVDWSLHDIRDSIRDLLEMPAWGEGLKGIPGGREIGQEVVEKYYAKERASKSYKGCASYTDFRELLEKEKDLDAVKVMTPDHLHAAVSIAAMEKGKHVVIHKPIANRIYEARKTIETAQKTGMSTHLLAWSQRPGLALIKDWIKDGAIGTLREIHNWSNRPVWPQWTANPVETPPIPKGFDWDLWLGPVPDRPYHPNYTHAVFRGWYDFGAGSIADMGTYSLWPLFMAFGLNKPPVSVEAYGTTTCKIVNHESLEEENHVAFPHSSIIRFKLPAQGEWSPLDLFWYDGGMKPSTPDELEVDNETLSREGMMFVGDRGKILAGFRGEDPKLIPEKRMREYLGDPSEETDQQQRRGGSRDSAWIEAFKAGTQSPGSFLNAGAVTETILLGAVALRAGEKILWDAENIKVTNMAEANKYLSREYRKGWEL